MSDLANSRRIHLIGPMGSGKSTAARRIAFFTGILNTLSPRPRVLILNSYDDIETLMRDL